MSRIWAALKTSLAAGAAGFATSARPPTHSANAAPTASTVTIRSRELNRLSSSGARGRPESIADAVAGTLGTGAGALTSRRPTNSSHPASNMR